MAGAAGVGGFVDHLRARVPLGSLLALIVTAALVGGGSVCVFGPLPSSARITEPVLQPSPECDLLRPQIRTLATDVELLRRVGTDRVVTGQFTGSPARSK
jgi:hypothetical protein